MAIDLNGSTGISLDDNEKINLGSSNDLQIYHDGTNSYLNNTTGNLTLDASSILNLDSAFSSGTTGGIIRLLDAGTQFGDLYEDSGNFLIASAQVDKDIIFKGNDGGGIITAMTIDMSAGGNVGIGSDTLTSASQSGKLKVRNDVDYSSTEFEDNATLLLQNETDDHSASLVFHSDNATGSSKRAGIVGGNINSNMSALGFYGDISNKTSATKPDVVINSLGNLLVNTTNPDVGFSSTTGSALHPTGQTHHSSAGTAIVLNRTTSDGVIANFRRNGSSVGYIGSNGGTNLTIYRQAGLQFTTGYEVVPNRNGNPSDNIIDLGSASYRFDDIRATNGNIQTSDFNEKQDIASLTATEMLVGKRLSELFKTFRWKDKVVEKGDNARTHTGVIAQDVQAAFTAEGLDAGDYSLFISDTWWETQTEVPAVEAVAEVTDEDGNVTTEAVEAVDAYTYTDAYKTEVEAPEGATERTRLGIRYPELLSFVAAYNEQRFASIEARLTALEA